MTEIFKGATDQSFYFKMVDSVAGTPETGLTIANIDATYTRNRAAAVKNDLTALGAANSAHADNQGIEVDGTNAPGLYRVDFPDAAFATGVDKVILTVTCTGCDPAYLAIDLVNINNQVAYVPNAAFDAAGGLPISDAGGLDLDAQRSDVAAILVDTGTTLDGRIPAALVSGRMDASVGAMAANVMTAAAAAADLTTELQSGLATSASITSLDGKLDTIDNFLDTEIAAIQADTDDIQTRLPAALVAGRMDASVGAMAANVMTAAATNADYVSELQAGLSTLDAAAVRTAIGMASANLDTQLTAIDDLVDTEVAAIKAKTDLIPGTQDGKTFAETIILMAAVILGKASGLETATAVFRNMSDTKARVTATTDADGNRTAVTLDAT